MKTKSLKKNSILWIFILISTVGIAQIQTRTFVQDGFTYRYTITNGVVSETVSLTEANPNTTPLDVVIPEEVSDGVNTFRVRSIGGEAFRGFGLTSVILPSSLELIAGFAFRDNQIRRIVFPENISVVGIGGGTFLDNPIEEIILQSSTKPPIFGEFIPLTNDFIDAIDDRQNVRLVVPEGSVDTYKNSGRYNGFFSINGIYDSNSGRTQLVNKIFYLFRQTGKNEVDIDGCGPNVTKNLTINETVTINGIDFTIIDIRNAAFQSRGLEKVTINSPRLKRIRGNAFRNNEISELTFSSNTIRLTDIELDAFNNNNLKEVVIPASVTALGTAAFRNNPLTEVSSLNPSPPSIGGNTFTRNDRDQINLKIPSGTTSVYNSAGWSGFKNIEELFFVDGQFRVDGIDYKVTATDPNKVKVISAVTSITSTNLVIPETVSVGNQTFAVTSVDNSAFQNAGLTSVSIPNSVTSIGINAFRGNLLTTVSIPNSVTSIGISAFRTNQLTSVTIGSSVSVISRNVFRANPNLSSVVSNSSNPAIISDLSGPDDDPFGGIRDKIELSVPLDAAQAYLEAGWTGFANIDEDFTDGFLFYDITSIAPNEVQVIGGIPPSDFTIPSTASYEGEEFTVTSIKNSALSNKNLTRVVLPNTFTDTGFAAFSDNNLTSVVLPEGITTIRKQSFQNNELASVNLPNSVTIIDNNAFRNNKLTQVTLPINVSAIGIQTFANNPITKVTSLNTTPPSIAGSSFSNRDQITLNVPQGTIAAYEAAGWTGFAEIKEFELKIIAGSIASKVVLEDDSVNPKITVFPNPVVDSFVMQGDTDMLDSAVIYNRYGIMQKVIAPKVYNQAVFMADLLPGIYFLQLTIKGEQSTVKLLKQ